MDDSKQDAVTATAHSKRLIELLKSKIWESTYGCEEQYRCAWALYLVSVFSQDHSIIIDRGISVLVHGKEVVDGLNYIDKRYIYALMSNVQLPV